MISGLTFGWARFLWAISFACVSGDKELQNTLYTCIISNRRFSRPIDVTRGNLANNI